MKSVELFIFDMDGVITESSEQHYLAWKNLAEEIGVAIDRSFNERLKGISRLASLDRILEHGGLEGKFTRDEKKQLANRKNQVYVEMISQFREENLFEGVVELFKRLKCRGIKIAIGSASKNAPMLVKLLGIEPYIDYIVNPEEVGNGKPAPDIFLKAAEIMGVDPCRCVGIEDAEAGVKAIKAAGMFAVGIGNSQVMKEADIIFAETKDINIDEVLSRFCQ